MAEKPKPSAVDDATLIELGRLSLQLAANKDTRGPYLKQVKKVNPSFVLPADIAEQELAATIDQKFAERDTKDATEATKARLERDRKSLMEGTLLPGRKFEEDDVKKIEKFMEEHGYTNYEHAAVIYGAQQSPPTAVADLPPSPSWTIPKVDNPFDTTKINNRAREQAFAAIRELRAGTR